MKKMTLIDNQGLSQPTVQPSLATFLIKDRFWIADEHLDILGTAFCCVLPFTVNDSKMHI